MSRPEDPQRRQARAAAAFEAADKELRAAAFAHGYKAGKPADTRRRLCRAAERYAAALRDHCDAFLSLQA